MSDIQLKSEITQLIHTSGFKKSKSLLCPIVRIVYMRHQDISLRRISKVARLIL